MPDQSETYGLEFTADVRDFATKAQSVTDSMNRIADAVERVNKAGRKGGPASPYVRQIAEARRELAATEKMAGSRAGDPYWADAIRKQRAVVANLQKKDRDEEAKKFEAERRVEADKLRQVQQQNAEKKRERQEEIQHLNLVARVINRAMHSVGLGRFAPWVTTAAQSGGGFLNNAMGGLLGSRLGVPMLGMIAGGIGAVGAGINQMRQASDTLVNKTPGWGEAMAGSQFTMPETALEKTQNARAVKLGMSTARTAVGEMLGGWWDKLIGAGSSKTGEALGALVGGETGRSLMQTLGYIHGLGRDQSQAQERTWFMERALGTAEATREARLRALGRLMGGEGAMPMGPQDEMSRMGYYATSGQAFAATETVQTQQKLVDAMRALVSVLEGKGSQATRQALVDVFGWRGR